MNGPGAALQPPPVVLPRPWFVRRFGGDGLLAVAVALVTLSCSTEVLQTAAYGPVDSLDCDAPGSPALPEDARFGDGTEAPSPLAGDWYGAGDGPGLYVTARDAFRVYLNGELVVESATARESAFVPLTLLPGDNALSIVADAGRGTPVVIAHWDDLDQSYGTSPDWAVSTTPEPGFAEREADVSDWSSATDYGPVGALVGCNADAFFPDGSEARWIGPPPGSSGPAAFRTVVRLAPVGFGENAHGGDTTAPVLVESWEELEAVASEPDAPAVILLGEGVHDFRTEPRDQLVCPTVCTNDATRTRYDVLGSDETCATEPVTETRTDRQLALGSNKTIVGLGRGAQIRGVSFGIGGRSNVILRNLALFDVNWHLVEAGDALTIGDTGDVWLDHLTIKWISDDFASIQTGTAGATVSWVRFDGVTEAACRGRHTFATTVTDSRVTYHHDFFDNVESHSPRVDNASTEVHLFNNLFRDNPGYAVNANCGGQALLEANTFQRVEMPTTRTTCEDETAPGLILAPEGSNFYGEDVGDHGGGDGSEPRDAVFTPDYPYDLRPPDEDWPHVFSSAGAGGRWPLSLSL